MTDEADGRAPVGHGSAAPPSLVLYGSLMRNLPHAEGERRGDLLDRLGVGASLRRIGTARFAGRLFDLGAYPAARPAQDAGDVVTGELYAVVDPQALQVLDEFEGFDPQHPERSDYLRAEITLLAPRDQRAWVYLHRLEPDITAHVPSGDWRRHLAERRASAHAPSSRDDDSRPSRAGDPAGRTGTRPRADSGARGAERERRG